MVSGVVVGGVELERDVPPSRSTAISRRELLGSMSEKVSERVVA